MSKPKILVADPISERGIAELQEGGLLEVTVSSSHQERVELYRSRTAVSP